MTVSVGLTKLHFVLFHVQGSFIDMGFGIVNSLHVLFLEADAICTSDEMVLWTVSGATQSQSCTLSQALPHKDRTFMNTELCFVNSLHWYLHVEFRLFWPINMTPGYESATTL